MKCLTICQPYAELIVLGLKVVENRTWPTTYRGLILIHAGKSRSWLATNDTGSRKALIDPESGVAVKDMAFGAIVGIATLAACLTKNNIDMNATTDPSRWRGFDWAALASHRHTEGPWCWVLKGVHRFAQPIPYKGELGIFNVPDMVVADQLAMVSLPATGEGGKEQSNG